MGNPIPPEDAQRELEQRALRNVRSLVEKMESLDASDSRRQKRMLVGLIVGATIVVGLIVFGVVYVSHKQTLKPVVIEPGKLPPIKPGPPAPR